MQAAFPQAGTHNSQFLILNSQLSSTGPRAKVKLLVSSVTVVAGPEGPAYNGWTSQETVGGSFRARHHNDKYRVRAAGIPNS